MAPEDVLRSVGSISFDADGVPHCRNTGKPLRDSIEAYVKSHPFTVASSPLEAHRPQDHIRSKADLKSIAEKSQYLEMYGEAQYARLPLTAQDPVQLDESLTWEQYKRLSVAQKVLLVNKYGEGFAARLHQKEQQKVRDLRLAGIPLERIKK